MNAKGFYKLFIRDLINSWQYGKIKYLVFFTIIIFLSTMKSLQIKQFDANSVGTFFLLLQDNGKIKHITDYQIPFYWNFIQFFILFLIGDYLFNDFQRNKTYALIRSGSRTAYISAKICWIFIQNIITVALLFLAIYVSSGVVLNDFSIGISDYFLTAIEPAMNMETSPEQLLFQMLVGFVLTSVVLSGIILLGMQFFEKITVFFSVILLCSISTFYGSKWLPAVHSMILKHHIFSQNLSLTFSFSIIYCIFLYAILSIAIVMVFRKKDHY
ncbi:hypothetical protein [Virgibacillus siamensis]|uniref:hypothetical protein n=1 Tax=Virgibacillus siamensis TaxID=480071 RepID=UPI000986792B|nr:hypothetical protein [Virgibacillus siamensis]